MVPTKLDTTESIAKDITLMQIFFFAFIKWLVVNRPESKVFYDSYTLKSKKNQSPTDTINSKIKQLIKLFNQSKYKFEEANFRLIPFNLYSGYIGEETDYTTYIYKKFRISFGLKDISLQFQRYEGSVFWVDFNNNLIHKKFASLQQLLEFKHQFSIDFMIKNYNENLEYCFNEKFFEDFYRHIERLWQDQFRDLIINYHL
jgi:hypothetical protein